MKSFLKRIFGTHRGTADAATAPPGQVDVRETGLPLVPDRFHLLHVGRTAQGNGYWITPQLATGDGETRDFIAAYVFDPGGALISCEVVDLGLRSGGSDRTADEVISRLRAKIDAETIEEIRVKPFSRSFFGHCFGLIIREPEAGDDPSQDTLIDAMPGYTLMFYGPWSSCNYDS